MNKIFIFFIICATFLSYANSLHNQFVWDDEDWILKNSTVQDWRKWPGLFTQNSIQGARKGSNFYRPLQAVTHGVDYLLWKYSLPGHHIPNVFFHILAAIFLFLLLGKIFSQRMAFFASFLFAVHPVHTEAVAYISGRADPLAAVFIFLTILLFERSVFLSALSFILAFLSKESALITVFLVFLCSLSRGKGFKQTLERIIPLIFIVVVYVALRLTLLDFSHTIPESAPKAFFYLPFYVRLATFLKTIPIYIKILVWPFGLHMERAVSLSYSIFQWHSAFGLLVAVVSFIAGFMMRQRNKLLLFSWAWFFIAIFPNSNVYPINALIYEHWLYLPSIGFFVVMAWAIERLFVKGRIFRAFAIILFIAVSVFYIWRTFERNRDWHDPIFFYESTIRYKSDSVRLHNNLAMAYVDAGREDDAVAEYRKAIACGDYYPQPHYNLSNIYLNRGDYEAAVKELERSIEIDNDFLYSHESLALIYFNQDKFYRAKAEALFILKEEPDNKIAIEILRMISDKGVPEDRPQDVK